MGEDRVAPRTAAYATATALIESIEKSLIDSHWGKISKRDWLRSVVLDDLYRALAEAASLDSDELRKLRAIEKAARDLNMTMPDLGDGDPMSDLDDALADYDEWLDAQDRALLSAGDKAAPAHRFDHDGTHRHHHHDQTHEAVWWENVEQFGGEKREHRHGAGDKAEAPR